MSQNKGDDAEYMADEYEREDVDNKFMVEKGVAQSLMLMNTTTWFVSLNGTTAAQARSGKDIQGIPWDRLSITREKFWQTRLEQYRNYENIPHSGEGSQKDCKVTKKGSSYYEFRRNSRSVKPTILHFQVRQEVLNVSGHVAPSEMGVWDMIFGLKNSLGFVSLMTTSDDNAITMLLRFMSAPGINSLDYMQRFMNHTSVSPDGKLLTIVGDNTEGMLVDSQTGKLLKFVFNRLSAGLYKNYTSRAAAFMAKHV
ncbi:hypothetical protein SO802_014123 [Lithocarpus litseifolius]|uniref:Uncharacterized protein n=1 Tax=Lithocarpus litseifolius TaxID=425828 RepID=A0AAW2CQI7_9ROSI